jgi:hypothetical protein
MTPFNSGYHQVQAWKSSGFCRNSGFHLKNDTLSCFIPPHDAMIWLQIA